MGFTPEKSNKSDLYNNYLSLTPGILDSGRSPHHLTPKLLQKKPSESECKESSTLITPFNVITNIKSSKEKCKSKTTKNSNSNKKPPQSQNTVIYNSSRRPSSTAVGARRASRPMTGKTGEIGGVRDIYSSLTKTNIPPMGKTFYNGNSIQFIANLTQSMEDKLIYTALQSNALQSYAKDKGFPLEEMVHILLLDKLFVASNIYIYIYNRIMSILYSNSWNAFTWST